MNIISKRASALRPDDVIIRHPDRPDERVRLFVESGAHLVNGVDVTVDYTAPPTEIPGLIPNGRAIGTLRLDANLPCQVEVAANTSRSMA